MKIVVRADSPLQIPNTVVGRARYDDVFQVGNRQYPLPEKGLEGKALADALAQFGVKPSQGQVTSRPDPAGWPYGWAEVSESRDTSNEENEQWCKCGWRRQTVASG